MLKEGIPRHSQISAWLKGQIEQGVFQPDEKLPSENELVKKFEVSRVTVRRALQSLENEEVIYRCQGLGSFVADSRTPHNLVRLTDFDEDMSRAGLSASSKVRAFKTEVAPTWLANLLNIPDGTKVMKIDRLRLGDGEPVAFDTTWLPLLYGQLLSREKLQKTTIYKILEDEYDIPIHRGQYRFSAETAGPELAAELRVDEHTALMLIDRLSFTIGEKPVYYQKRYYRPDKVVYEMRLERNKDSRPGSGDMPMKEFTPVFPGLKPAD